MSTNSPIPLMQVKAFNGSSAQNAALNNFTQGQLATANLSALAGGKQRRRRHRGGQPPAVVVAQAPVAYNDQSIPAINGSGGLISQLTSTLGQSNANAKYDSLAASKGGYRKRRTKKMLKWGCYSGGKSRRRRKSRKTKK